ncbi:MAG: hypothetical protein AB8G77_04650 [Rhodothermales bacterium]
MSLSFGVSPLLLIPCLLVAAALGFWVYHRTIPVLAPAKRYTLTALRTTTLFLVLFLLFKPILENIINTEQPPLLAVLIDDSQSLQITIEEETDSLNISEVTRNTVREFTQTQIDGNVRYFRFSNDVVQVASSTTPADSLGFDGERTNMAHALAYLREQYKDENLQGVLLISDGQYNTGRNPVYLAERYPVPIHTIVVGDTTRRRDLQIRRVSTNDIAYVGDELPIRVGLLSEGFGGERVSVSLFENGTLLNRANVDLPAGTVETPVDLFHTPETEGFHRYTVAVSRLTGEATYRNNTESFAVRVLENKKRILLFAASPEPDVAAIQQLLDQDPNIEVSAYIQKTRGEFYNPSLPDSLNAFDAIILAGYPGRFADPAIAERVAKSIEDGLPAFFMLSRQTDLSLLRRAFVTALPVQPRVLRTNFIESTFVPTAEGLQHPILQISETPDQAWITLPPLIFNDTRWQAAPDARVLATQQVRGIALDDPLLIIRNRNQHRTAVLLGAGTWRWKNLPDDLQSVAPFWVDMFSNTLQWITTKEDDRPVRVAPIEDLFSGGASIQFDGQVYDESLNPVDGASLEVEVMQADSILYPYSMEPVGNGRYALNIGALPEGTYRYRASAQQNGTVLGTDAGSFAVGSLTLEYKETRADGQLMHQIAQRSGGWVFASDQSADISQHLASSDAFVPVIFEERVESELWQRYFFFVLILVLLTIEWFVRKRSGMV